MKLADEILKTLISKSGTTIPSRFRSQEICDEICPGNEQEFLQTLYALRDRGLIELRETDQREFAMSYIHLTPKGASYFIDA